MLCGWQMMESFQDIFKIDLDLGKSAQYILQIWAIVLYLETNHVHIYDVSFVLQKKRKKKEIKRKKGKNGDWKDNDKHVCWSKAYIYT